MTEPTQKDLADAEAQLHAGPRDEGGQGGMATRELRAREEDDEADEN